MCDTNDAPHTGWKGWLDLPSAARRDSISPWFRFEEGNGHAEAKPEPASRPHGILLWSLIAPHYAVECRRANSSTIGGSTSHCSMGSIATPATVNICDR